MCPDRGKDTTLSSAKKIHQIYWLSNLVFIIFLSFIHQEPVADSVNMMYYTPLSEISFFIKKVHFISTLNTVHHMQIIEPLRKCKI